VISYMWLLGRSAQLPLRARRSRGYQWSSNTVWLMKPERSGRDPRPSGTLLPPHVTYIVMLMLSAQLKTVPR
jgi:hypothetical protein